MVANFTAQASGPTILQNPFFINIILPFLLVFTIVFAILQKSEVLGKGKKQIDALVALVIGLIFVAFSWAVNLIDIMVPFLAVSLIVIFVFLVLWGSVWGNSVPSAVKIVIGILVALAVSFAVLYVTGSLNYLYNLFLSEGVGKTILMNVIMGVFIIGAILVILLGKGGGEGKKES